MQHTPWKVNAQSFMIMYTILAATAGIFLVGVLFGSDEKMHTYSVLLWSVVPLSISILLFIVSGEGITDALDEDDVRKYASLFIPYNVAVIFLFVGIYALVYFKYLE